MPRKKQPNPSRNARLEKYHGKRDFGKTPEPDGDMQSGPGFSYVIQEHHARSHHFDLRLEMDGVLVSWAVPKAIPEEASEKRLAVRVEDHPLDYGSFEGEIPKGNYGAGKVVIWDSGDWTPVGEKWERAFTKGKLKFHLRGKRLDGTFLLARMGDEPNWLLRKLTDKDNPSAPAPVRETACFIEPQLAKVVSSVPTGKEWCHEIKFDGYRLVVVKSGGTVRLYTRNSHDWTDRFAGLSKELAGVSESDFVLDGEAVVFDEKGKTDFGGLQEALKDGADKISFVVFDLLHLDGQGLRDLPLSERLSRLERLIPEPTDRLRVSHRWPGGAGKKLFKQACENGLEGIVSKRLTARYLPGSRKDWAKSKCRIRQEFVICGYTPPKGGRSGFGALVLGSFENGKWVARGKVGTGFTDARIAKMMELFTPLVSKVPLFTTSEKHVTWLRPELAAEIGFAEITRDGSIRQGSFLGLREDKPPGSIRLEPTSVSSEVAGITISNPDRVVIPDTGTTKIEVARHYERVGDLMLPYVAGRPLAVLRTPGGISGEQFFQKSFPSHIPPGVDQTRLPDGTTVFSISDTKGLVSLAQFGVMEFHPWGSTLAKPDIAEFLTWDLDPDSAVSWRETLGAAFLIRDHLHGLGLDPMVKTSGGKGLHIMVRIRRVHKWETMRKFSKDVARAVAAMNPSKFLIVSTKAKRKGRIFIDWMRNGEGSTCIAPWCVRAREGAKVSMPVGWDDLAEIPPQGFTISKPINIPEEWRDPAAQSISSKVIKEATNG